MKRFLYLTIFLIVMIYSVQSLKENNLKADKKSNSNTSLNSNTNTRKFSQSEEDLMKQMFSTLQTQACAAEKASGKSFSKLNQKSNPKSKKGKDFLKAIKSDLFWVSNWGYGHSAYFYDYLNPVFRDLFISEAKRIYNEIINYDNKKDGNYLDPFDYNNFITQDMSAAEKAKVLSNLKNINANYVKEIFDISVNAVQLHIAMKKWKWVIDSSLADYAQDFIMKYDANGDGRLSPRELILGAIDHNRTLYGSPNVKFLFEPLMFKLIAMFDFIDCSGKGYISAERIWTNIPNLQRGDGNANKYNIFGLNKTLRMTAINDFVLKTHDSKNGLLNMQEFISGILFGFWNRQTSNTLIVEDDSRSLINLRWTSNNADVAYEKLADLQKQEEEQHK